MKISIAVATYYPEKNGVQFITQNLAEGLKKNGHEVTVLTGLSNGKDKITYINGVKVCRFNIRKKNMIFFGDKNEYLKELIEISKDMDVMVFVSAESAVTAFVLNVLEYISCQKVLYLHGMHEFKWKRIDFCGFRNFIFKILRDIRWGIFYTVNKKKIGKFDKFIHLHEEDSSYKYFEKRYHRKNYVLENFAEDMFFQTDINDKELPSYYVCISNYHSRKNQKLLLKASYLMNDDIKLVFIGSTDNKYYYDLLKEKNKLDRKYSTKKDIDFLHGIDRKKFPAILRNAYAYVLTSKWEAFPITIIESLASGTPYISTDVGIVKFLPGGMIVSDDAEDIAKKMDLLLVDKKKYEELKEEAISYAQNHFIFENYLAKFEEIIH